MRGQRFDDLARKFGDSITARRDVLKGLAAGAATLAMGHPALSEAAAKRQRRSRRKRRERKVLVCHEGQEIRVPKRAVPAHLNHGDQLGRCRLLGGTETCEGSKLPCDTEPTFCGGDDDTCACFVTTIGGSVCAANSIQCLAQQSTCIIDDDCVDRYGDGYACVPTFGCEGIECGGNGNACAPPCQQAQR